MALADKYGPLPVKNESFAAGIYSEQREYDYKIAIAVRDAIRLDRLSQAKKVKHAARL